MGKGSATDHVNAHGHGGGGAIHHLFEPGLEFTNVVCGWILLLAVAVALLNLSLLLVQHLVGRPFRMQLAVTQPRGSPLSLDRIKLELARFVGFCLLLLVPADVLETLIKPMHDVTMEELYKLAIVGGVRTTLAYFLGKEMGEIMEHIEHAEHHSASSSSSEHHDGSSQNHSHHDGSKATDSKATKGTKAESKKKK